MITIGYCSNQHDEKFYNYASSAFGEDVEVIEKLCNQENGKTICESYNEILRESENDIVILMHNNVEVVSTMDGISVSKLTEMVFERNPDIGIVGISPRCRYEDEIVKRETECVDCFYMECRPDGSNPLIYENHVHTKPFTLDVSVDPLIDGVFMCIHKGRIKKGFNEKNKTFHLYDLLFCVDNYTEGVGIGTTKAFLIMHYQSQSNEKALANYKQAKEELLGMYKDKLPIVFRYPYKPVLLLTPTMRGHCLPKMYKSIHESMINGYRNFIWLICVDKQNCDMDFDEISDMAKKQGWVNTYITTSGKLGQKNYGGDMFNEPLREMYNAGVIGDDTWVYIYDDDNILCPIMCRQLPMMIGKGLEKDKGCIWMAKLREDGFIDTIRSWSVFAKGVNNDFARFDEFAPDPSQLIMRYSLIRDMGMFTDGYAYDQDIWNYLYEHLDTILYPEDWLGYYWKDNPNNNLYQCYHNGSNSKEEILKSIEECNEEGDESCFSVTVAKNNKIKSFTVPHEIGAELLEILSKL